MVWDKNRNSDRMLKSTQKHRREGCSKSVRASRILQHIFFDSLHIAYSRLVSINNSSSECLASRQDYYLSMFASSYITSFNSSRQTTTHNRLLICDNNDWMRSAVRDSGAFVHKLVSIASQSSPCYGWDVMWAVPGTSLAIPHSRERRVKERKKLKFIRECKFLTKRHVNTSPYI